MTASRPLERLIALGASNLTNGALRLLDAARAATGAPVEAFAALGHGRSYGVRSSLLGRTLPGIDDCELWTALERAGRRSSTALVMDVGNDILYGFDPDTILRWVDDALQRLAPHADALRLAGLPLESVARLGPVRFQLVRRLLVPGSRLTLARARERVHAVDAGLQDLARRRGAAFVPLPGSWFGYDVVHVRRRLRAAAFAGLLGVPPAAPAAPLAGAGNALRLLRARPARRWRLGREQIGEQPALRFADGSTLALY
ncbi:MAG: hypothetical protein AB7O97_21600 [Planctomycetota bacterium]